MKKTILLLALILVIQQVRSQDRRIISGSVIDAETEMPIGAATITATKTLRSVISDPDGKFQIQIGQFDSLRITHVSYEPVTISVPLGSEIHIRIRQRSSVLDNAIINTGYQEFKPNQVNGAFDFIDEKTLSLQNGTNILTRLEGVTTGLLFDNQRFKGHSDQSQLGLSIRGLSTINGPLDPLIIVDNFIFEGDINHINPDDVKSVTILKDAATTSIWGARAGNGVIVITMKHGSVNQKPRITFNSNLSLIEKPDLYRVKDISIDEYIDLEKFLFDRGHYDNLINNNRYPAISPVVSLLLKERNGTIPSGVAEQEINALRIMNSKDEFARYFYRTGAIQQYSLMASGGSKDIAWLMSGSYDKTLTNLNEQSHRLNMRFSNTYKPFKGMELITGASYSNLHNKSGMPEFRDVAKIRGTVFIPYLKFVGEDGTALPISNVYRSEFTDTLGGNKLLDWHYYPYNDWKHAQNTVQNNELIANLAVKYRLTPYANLSVRYQYQEERTTSESLYDTASFYARRQINLFTQIDGDDMVTHIIPMGGILMQNQNRQFSHNFRSQADFSKGWKDSEINALAGFEFRDIGKKSNSNTYYGYYDDPLTSTDVDVVNYYPTIIAGDFSQIGGSPYLTGQNYRFVSLFANGLYSFQKRYFVNAGWRKDGSNVFGASINDKWKPLWSSGIGWLISEESFYKLKFLTHLKLSITYGKNGNVDLTKTPLAVARADVGYTTDLPFLRIDNPNNPGLKWEEISQTNIRIDFELMQKRILGSIDYYLKKGSDLYGADVYDYTAWGGRSTLVRNVAAIKGKGLEINIISKNLTGALKWNTQLLFSHINNQTTRYYSAARYPESGAIGNAGKSINPIVGKPMFSVFAYKWGGLDKDGNPQGFISADKTTDYNAISKNNGDNGIAGGSMVYKGSAIPTTFGNLSNFFIWKNLEFNFNFSFAFGHYLFKPALSYTALFSQGAGNDEFSDRWQKPGDEQRTNIPSLIYPANSARDLFYQYSEANLIKGDNIRLRYINFKYTLNTHSHKIIENAEFYASIINMGIVWRANHNGIDPDFPGDIPPPKRVTFGVRLTL